MGYELGGGVNNPGRMRFQLCEDIAGYVLANRRRLNVTYVIWNRRIASAESSPAWSWRTYHGNNPHTDHVHVSFEEAGTYRPPTPVKEDEDVTPEDVEKIAQRAAELVWTKRLTDGNPATTTDPEARSWLVGGMSKWDRQRSEMKTVLDLLTSIQKRLEEMQ